MLVGWHRHMSRLLMFALLASFIPGATVMAPAPAIAAAPSLTDDDSPSQLPVVTPTPDAHLPALTIEIDIAPDTIVVGDSAAITLTIANAAPDPADDLVVTLPAPDGALPLPGPGFVSVADGWQWDLGHLPSQASATLTATLQLVRLPQGQHSCSAPRPPPPAWPRPSTLVAVRWLSWPAAQRPPRSPLARRPRCAAAMAA